MADYNDIYYDTYSDGSDTPAEKGPVAKILSLFFKVVGLTILAVILGLFIYRFWSIKEPADAVAYLWSEKTLSLAEEEKLEIYTQELLNYVHTDEVTGETTLVERSEYYVTGTDNDGNYKVSYPCYTPAANEFQITFRYNQKVLDFLMADLGLLSLPDGYPFVFALMTADGKLVESYSYTASTRAMYTYRRILFENVPDSSTYYLNVYYNGGSAVDLASPYISMVVYDENLRNILCEEDAPQTATQVEAMPPYQKASSDPS